MQEEKKKNVPERPHTVKNITGRSYKFPLETVIEMCISGHVDCRFFFVIMVLLALKSESASCLSPRQQKPWDQKTTAGYLNSTKKNSSKPRAFEQQLWILEGKQYSTSHSKSPRTKSCMFWMKCCGANRLRQAGPGFCLHPLCFLSHQDPRRVWCIWEEPKDGCRVCIRIFHYQKGLSGIKNTVRSVSPNACSPLLIISYKQFETVLKSPKCMIKLFWYDACLMFPIQEHLKLHQEVRSLIGPYGISKLPKGIRT